MPLPAHLDRTPHMRAIAAGALLATALLTSIAIMLTVTLGAAPKVAAQEPVTDEIQTLVSNVDARDVDDDTINVNLNGTAQVFRTGPQLGIRLDSIDVKFGTSVDKKYIVLNAGLHAVNDDGSRGARLTGFSYGDKKNNQMNRFWARDQVELEPSTAYMFVITCTAGCANNNYLNIRRVSDNAEDEGSAEGWSIDDGRILPSDNWTPKPRTHSLKMSVQGTSGHPRVVEDGFEIISSPVIGNVYGNRELIRVGVTFTDPVTVNDDAGTPTLKFSLGDPDNPARTERMRYASGSGTDTLVFEYRVLPDDQDANGIYIHSNSLQLNGGTINRAGYDLAALLRHPIPTGYGRARIDSSIERPLAKLTDLKLTDPDITDIVLRPDFSPDLINYAATVHGGVAATTVTATRDDDTNVTITPADSHDFQPGHQVPLEPGNNFIEILVTKPGHIDVPYTVEIHREPLVIPRITRVRVISSPLNQNTNVYRNDETVEFEFTFDHPVVVDLTGGRPTLAVDIWLNDSPQSPTDFPYARGSGTNALVFQLLNDEAGLLETAVGFGLSANSINVPEHSSITHSPGGGNANLNHRALHRISNQYLDDRRNAPLAALDQVHLTNVTLDQRFRSRKTLYTATPDHGTTVTTVTVTPKDGVSYTIMPEDADDVADGHQVTLHHGTNEIVLTATKEGAATMTYTIAVVVLTTPRVESIAIVSEAPDNQTYVVGDVIKIAVTFDQPILVDTTNGTPIIRVRFGSEEQPVDYSETTDDSRTIIFSHTVDHSRRDGDGISIPENPMNANGGIIRYLHSNTRAFLDHQGIPDQTQHRVDPDPAIIDDGVQITSNPIDSDTYDSGETITFTVQFNTQITVKTDEGTPYLQLTMGDDVKQAGHTAISGDKRTLTFSYTVAAGDLDDDGISMAANALSRNGGTIKDENSINDALLEHPAPGTNGVFIGHNVDGNRPTIADGGVAVISTPLALPDAYGRNEIIVVSVTFTSPVVVDTTDGTPTLSIKVATPTYFPLHRKAAYQRGSGSSTLQFEWRVRRIDWDTNGIGILADALQLNGGTIRDTVTGTDVLLTNPWIDPVINFPDHKVRGGLLADFASLSDLSLSGGTLRPAFDSTVLRYTAAFPTDTTSTTVTATAPSGNTVAIQPDDADSETTGHQVDLTQEPEEIIVTVTTASAATYIYRVKTFLSDTEITSLAISSDPGSDSTYATGDVITATVTYNVPVTVDTTDGTPALKLKVGDTARAASYTGTDASGKVLTFSYTVVSEDSDQEGVSIAANSLTLNSGSIAADEDDADALLIHVALPTQAGHLVNKIPLIVTDGVQITSNPASGDTYQAGETITFTVTLDSDVEVDTTDGTPSLAITLGNANRQAAYTGIDATKRILTFAYTVATEDLDEDGLSVPANAIALNNGTITHTTTGKDADLSHGQPGTSGSFPNHRADGSPVAPAIAADGVTVTSTPYADGDTYGRDDIIVIGVTFTTPVAVDTTDGTPTLSVRIGDAGLQSRNRKAEYKRGTGSATLQFEWRVRANDRDNNGIQILADSLELNGGTIQHATNGTDALLTHPLPGGNGIFAGHKVDGRLLPALASLSALSFSGATLSPTFDPATVGYTATFPADAASTTVTATAESGTTITIEPADSDTETDGHQVDLTEAPDEITVTVSRTDSTDRVYRVNIALTSAIITAPAIADGGVTITSMPLAAADTYGRNEIIVISVAFTSPVVVNTADGTPTMTFKVGNAGRRAATRKAEYQRGSGSSTLQFEWRVAQGSRDNNGIRIRANALQLNGGTIRDAATGIDALLTHPDPVSEITFGNHKLDGRLLADFTNLSDLSLSGGTLAPDFGPTVLRYTATFPADATSTTVTATAPSDHTVTIQPADSDTEATGHQVDLTQESEEVVVTVTTASAATYAYRVKIVVSSPEITALDITSDPGADGTYATGDVITVAATYNVPVTVDTTDGTPSLALTIGDNARDAGYTETGALGRKITFSYTVVSDDSDQDGISIAANSLALNSGTIRNAGDTMDASPDHTALDTQTGHVVNKIPLIVAGGVQITSTPASGDTYQLDETITFTVTFDSNVDVDTTDGTPYLVTNLGNTSRQAAYTGIDATRRILTFSYTVAADDMDEDGLSVPSNALALNGGTIKHTTTGKDADLSHGLPGASGSFPNHRADGDPDAPAITSVTLSSDAGTDNTYATGDAITVAVTYGEAVAVDTTSGTPSLTLTVGSNARSAGYTTIDSAATTLTFSYTVVSDDSDQDGIAIAANSLALNSGTIRNKADTVDASLTHAAVSMQSDHLVNKIPLIVAGGVQITSNPASGDTYLVGETITFTATFDAPVTVTTAGGFPLLAFTLGSASKTATYNSTSANGETLGFSYTVVAGDLDTDGVSVAANALSLNGGTIKHSTTDKDADLSHPLPGTSGLFAGHKVDAIPDAPTITSVTLTSNAGTDNTYATYDAITAAVTYSEAIVVDTTDGTPSLALTIGDTARSAGYTSIDSSETVLTFSYTVISDDSDQDGIAIAANSLALNAGTIRNKADTVDAALTHAAVATQTDHLVNKIPLIITDGVDITSSPASGNPYAPGEAITFGVTFDSDVIVDTTNGTPSLALTVGSTAKQATYTTIDATNRILTFSYAVVSGDLDEDGVSVSANALALNNGAIKHFTTGRDADLSHPLPGTNGVFPQHQVGRRDITALSISSDPGIHATYATGDTITVAVTFAEPVTVDTTGGTPYLPLTIGSMTRNAAYTSTDSSGLALTFSYTIVAEDRDNNGPSIAANALTLDGGTIRYAGTANDVSLAHPALPNQTGHRINRAPAIVNNGVDVTSSPLGDETYGLNETITISVTFNSVVVVDTTNGRPRVDVLFAAYHNDDDDRARFRYARGSGTKTLEFDYTVQSGDRDANGIFISLNQLFLDGGTITHITTGRNANLRHGPAGDSGTLAEDKVDGSTINIPRPRISSIEFGTDPSRLQTYITGSTINVIVTFDEEVAIDETNGTLTIALTIGDAVRNAAYVGSISGTIDMHFYYTVVAEDSDQDGVSIAANAISLNGATIRNSDDTVDASLAHAALPDNPDHVVNKIPLIVTGGVQIASTPSSDDTYGRNEIITFIVAFDSDVTVDVIDGAPYLEFTIGDNLRTAAYDASSSSDRSLVFSYTVVQADSDDDGVSMAANAVNLDGALITHSQIGTDADLTHPAPGIFAGHEVDGSTIAATRPVITGLAISSDPGADRTYAAGDVITATVTFDQPVTVTFETPSGELWLPLTIGESQREAHYSSTDSSGHVLSFAYTVVEQDSDPDGVSIPRNSISSQSVRVDLSGQTFHANLFHLELDDQPDHRVNAVPRIINRGVRIESSPRNGDTYRIGETISFSVTFDAPVVVDTTNGRPHMRLRVDESPGTGNAPYLRYSSGSGSRTLYFSWIIPQRTRDHSGIYMGANQLHAGRGSIRHASTGRDAILEHERPGRLDGEFPDHKILPRHYRYITNLAIASDAGDDRTYRTGDVITATIRFNDDIDLNTAGGTPFFRLIIGETLRLAQYSAQDSTSDTLHFHYTVVAEDRDDDGVYMRSNGLQLNGSVITAAGETDEAFVKHPWVEDQHRHRVNTP